MSSFVLALGAAILFAVGNQCSRLALRHTDSLTVTLYQIAVGTGIYWLAAPLYLERAYWSSPVLPLLAAIGLFRPILSANLGNAGTRILGPTVSATVSATAPLFGVGLGVWLLAESLSWEIALGTAGIVAGVATLSWRGGARVDWPLVALLFPVGAAFLRSLAQALAKVALETLPDPFFVALVAYSVSLPIALAYNLRMRGRGFVHVRRAGLAPLVATGTCYSTAVLLLNTALLRGELVTVSPIVACSPLFTMLLGYLVFREQALTARVAVAVLLVVPGVVLIGLR